MLTHTAYGKSRIRLVQVARRGDRHDLHDRTVAIRFEGDYDASYRDGDNRDVLPTDTMKNTVYALAARHRAQEPESFALTVGRHFLERNPRLHRVRVDLTEYSWRHITIGEREHGQSFMRRGPDTRTASVTSARDRTIVQAGVDDLLIMKTSHSAFADFPRDEYTTLPETRDRLLVTSVTATWHYRESDVEFGPSWRAVRGALLEAFAEHNSLSVQHTLYAMGQAVLDNVDVVDSITLAMPNKHHLPVDLSRFGLENKNEIFVATDEPYGFIEATVGRKG
jgi:urate oxidase